MNTHESVKNEHTPESFREMVVAFQKSRLMLTAFELGLFTVLGEENKTSKQVAKALKTAERATDRLMNALCAFGLLSKKENKFSNTPFTARFLIDSKPEYMGGLMHSVHLWRTWSTLTDAVKKGTSVAIPDVNERGNKWLEAFIAAMHERAYKMSSKVVAMLDLNNVSRVLDVGGGSGAYAMAFARTKADLKATVFDLPNVIPIAKKYIKKEGLWDKVDTMAGDYNKDNFEQSYDVVFLSAIIHSNSSKENQKLIKKCVKVLNHHGQVVVQDFIMNEERTGPPWPALFALNMLVGTMAGDTYTESEVRFWMENAGLAHVIRKDTDFNTTLIIGSVGV